jgi:Domain of unknown function (DUF1707)
MGAVTEPVRPEDLRVSDVERESVAEHLRRAQEVGQLDIHEFDERTRAVFAARTRGELERVTVDLPAPPPAAPPAPRRPPRAPSRRVFSDTRGGTTMRVLTTIWLSVLAVNMVVWALVSAGNGDAAYPWWIWLGPPGAALLVLYVVGIGRPRSS